ncbi:leukocyte immunoglobulin-like receptor subfamily A member 6 [Peromyscus eremicus]|uniref:leukocyte immunoglobulin-like receptor subfamily A member 6 n=1 Tax=Peromyscus eremicus TaxID=42410 RepID=UPI0027DCEDA9|nr:leukocyte immunoglobulin-like receptor subfamily A member 6 [Peromyscus eremicus]
MNIRMLYLQQEQTTGMVNVQRTLNLLVSGTPPKPKIWAEPQSVIAIYAPVTIWCQGSWEAKEYRLLKEGSSDPWDRQSPLEHMDKAKFYLEHMIQDFAGIYKCYYKSPAGWSEHSDTLVLVLTGVYDKPSLSVWTSHAVTSGETITMQCSSSLGFGRFILIQEGKHHISWTLDSQQNAEWESQAHFVLDPVTTIHNGTFRCYGYFKNHPQMWSESSGSLHLLVSDSKDQSPIHTENGTLTKPKIWAEPQSVIASYATVTIWCQGSSEAQEYRLLKEGSSDPWDRQSPLESLDKAKFCINYMTHDFAGIYKCCYKSPAGWSEHSDTLELVLTEAYDKPSLSVWPSPAVTSGENITMQCSSSLGFGTFILIQEGKHHLSWTLDSQQNANLKFQAHFVLDPVTTIHNGTFRCYGYFRNSPQMWSKSSDPLHLLVSESKDESPTHTENGLGRYQKVLIGVLVSLLLLFFLLILLILFRYQCKGKEKKAGSLCLKKILNGTRSHFIHLIASLLQNPPDEEPQGIVYVQVKPSMLYKAGITSSFPLSEKVLDMKNNQSGENREMYPRVGSVHLAPEVANAKHIPSSNSVPLQATTSKEPQDVTYAQLCIRTLE